jgi:predicted GNAT family N-acyltransferase
MPELRVVTAADTEDLRREVLRGGRPVALPGDDDPTVLHLGLYDGDRLLATGNLRREPAASAPDVPAWRVRGMATVPERRGQGLGEQILLALLAHACAHGGGEVWCHARTPARSLYERVGFEVVGEPWVDPEIGPHVLMVRR